MKRTRTLIPSKIRNICRKTEEGKHKIYKEEKKEERSKKEEAFVDMAKWLRCSYLILFRKNKKIKNEEKGMK